MSDLDEVVRARVEALEADRILPRIWDQDHTVWRPDPGEISDRLGWLHVHEEMTPRIEELRTFAQGCVADGLRWAVLCGMGGSSLAPEVFRESFGAPDDALDLVVLDTTHPDQILALEEAVDLDRSLFVIASKSGTTVETRSHLEHFWARRPDGARFVAITDPGTPLSGIAAERRFRRGFENPPDIGGRYSALSYFGLVPAALIGADLGALLDGAGSVAAACGPEVPAADNPAAVLGGWLGVATLAGRDKLTMAFHGSVATLASWVEQLIAESTGKEGTGIVPIEGEALGPPTIYGSDRLFVGAGSGEQRTILAWLERSGHPVFWSPVREPSELGGAMFRWELATAVVGHILGIQPFDQPDVQAAKDATDRVLTGGIRAAVEAGDLGDVVSGLEPGDYVAIQAFVPRDDATAVRLRSVRHRIRDRRRMATTVGFGPRFLHSTGQLHKGGPPTAVCLQVVEEPEADVRIPGQAYSFGDLLAAQADGDLQALRDRGRRVARVSMAELETFPW
ncbi:MAG TPA: glucose-6-phosphate isomerase [Actinomycetota bacterium]|nr:glucose-6-phosphate isomerase [Actinomycetota bacterium]